jgi:hypothetical protein
MVELPQAKKAIECQWVFTAKYKSDEIVDKYKTRLVAKGYTGLTIERLLLMRPRWTLVRVILSLVVNLDWSLQQLDVKKAFLHDDMVKEMYMDPFLRFMTGGKSSYRGLSSVDWATQWISMVLNQPCQITLYSIKGKVTILYCLLFMLMTWLLHKVI